MNIRELRADDLAPLLGLYTHLHEHDVPLPSAPEVQAVWEEVLANPRDRLKTMAMTPEQKKSNLRMALILASVAVAFFVGFVVKVFVLSR